MGNIALTSASGFWVYSRCFGPVLLLPTSLVTSTPGLSYDKSELFVLFDPIDLRELGVEPCLTWYLPFYIRTHHRQPLHLRYALFTSSDSFFWHCKTLQWNMYRTFVSAYTQRVLNMQEISLKIIVQRTAYKTVTKFLDEFKLTFPDLDFLSVSWKWNKI